MSDEPVERFEYDQAHELFRHYDDAGVLAASILLPIAFGILALSFQLDEHLPDFKRSLSLLAATSLLVFMGGIIIYARLHFLAQKMACKLRTLEDKKLKVYIHVWLRNEDRHWIWRHVFPLLYAASFLFLISFWAYRLGILFT